MEERGPYKAEVPGSIPGPPTTEIFGHFYGFSPSPPNYLDDRKGQKGPLSDSGLSAEWQRAGGCSGRRRLSKAVRDDGASERFPGVRIEKGRVQAHATAEALDVDALPRL